MRTAELDNILNDCEEARATSCEIKSKKRSKNKSKDKAKQPAKAKLLTTAPITLKQTRSKWLNEIKQVVEALPKDKCINIIDVYGGNGLLCYWFKELAAAVGARVKIFLNDWDNLCCKYSLTDKYEHYLDGVNIIKVDYSNPLNFVAELIDMDIDTSASDSILILDARCFDINVLYYIYNNFSIILFDNADDYSKTNIINCYNNALQIFGAAKAGSDAKGHTVTPVDMDTETVWKSASEYMFKRLQVDSAKVKAKNKAKEADEA